MILSKVELENFRMVQAPLELELDPRLNVFVGRNAEGKTTLLEGVAIGLGWFLETLTPGSGRGYDSSYLTQWLDSAGLPTYASTLKVKLYAKGGCWWTRSGKWELKGRKRHFNKTRTCAPSTLRLIETLKAAGEPESAETLPVFAYYGTDRSASTLWRAPKSGWDFNTTFSRFTAYHEALEPSISARDLFEWIHAMENHELRTQRAYGSFSRKDPLLETVRRAIRRLIPGAQDLTVQANPLRLELLVASSSRPAERIPMNRLSDGQRAALSMVADIARRMAVANPQLPDPLDAEAIVLIDEVDLHLHASWQQTLLSDLLAVFPNAQFLVTTHSDKVLTAIHEKHIRILERTSEGLRVHRPSTSSYGAESQRVLEEILGVPPRPANEFSRMLQAYQELIQAGQGEGEEAKVLRQKLVNLNPDDPEYLRLDLEVKRQKALLARGKRP